jgi:hypothetical protein
VANWALRRVDTADFNTEVSVENGQGVISVEALDAEGNYRNFLTLQTAVVSPKGDRVLVNLEQAGPGRYEAKFPTKEVGAYLLNLMEVRDGQMVGAQVLGASVNHSPEFNATEPNLNLLHRLAEAGGGKVLSPDTDNPFLLGRKKTFQPRDLWEALLKWFIILFVLDVAVRRVDIDREEWGKWLAKLKRRLGFGDLKKATAAQGSLGSLLAIKERVRGQKTAAGSGAPVATQAGAELFKPKQAPTTAAAGSEAGAGETSGSTAATETPTEPAKQTSATGRLLEAKRRAQRRR